MVPRDALPALGLLGDPQLFEVDDLAKRLERNLIIGERITILSPGEIRQRRQRGARYRDQRTADAVNGALHRLDAYRRGDPLAGLTLEDAERLVTLTPDAEPNGEPVPEDESTDDGAGNEGGDAGSGDDQGRTP